MTEPIPHDLFRLDGCVAVVSGASGWLGSAMVDALARAGASVVAVGRTRTTLEAATEPARAAGLDVEARTCDVGTAEWPQLVVDVAAERGRLDILVNNAHIGRGGSLRTATDSLFDEAWQVGVKAAWVAVEAARPGFAASVAAGGAPSIINVGSMYGLVAPDFTMYATEEGRNPPFYGAAKAALGQLTRYAAAELGPDGVRANLLVPGPFPQHPEQMDPAFVQGLASRTMLGRVGTPDDIRTAVLFLATPRSSFVTGATLVVDGGWTAR
jgi:NAD(P)-dependent dehydrogenase (short-subunit alcohol dehydrogenase family)